MEKGYLKHLDNKNICEKKNIDVDYKIRNFGEEDNDSDNDNEIGHF